MPCKEIYTLLHFYLQINEPVPAEVLCSVFGWVKLEVGCWVKLSVCPRIVIDLAVKLINLETWNFQER